MCGKIDLTCVLFLLCYYLNKTSTVNAINYQPQLKVPHAKRQVGFLQSKQQQHQPQLQRYDQHSPRTLMASKESIFRPMVRFLTATPNPQQSQANGNNLPVNNLVRLDNHQSKTFIIEQQQHRAQQIQQKYTVPLLVDLVNQHRQRTPTQQQQQHFFKQSNQQQNFHQRYQHLDPVPSLSSLKQLSEPSEFSQQQQQALNFPHYVRLSQISQQHHPCQTQQPQQSLQLQHQNLNFRLTQQTSGTQHQQIQQHEQYSRPSHINPVVNLGGFNSTNAEITPLLPSYADEDDSLTPFNFTLPCQICCIEGQIQCQQCCDTRPLLSAAVLKSSTG